MNITTKEDIIKLSQSEYYELPEILSDQTGLDIDLSSYGWKSIPTWGRTPGNPKRRVTLKITTFRGISSSAIHFYGKIIIQGVYISQLSNLEKPARGTRPIIEINPTLDYEYQLNLSRFVTEDDFKISYSFEHYKVGDFTDRFNSIEDLINFYKLVIKTRFIGNWEFRVNYSWKSSSLDEIIYI